ncbi:MAG: VWA domain-containing protein [Treponema sp.]|nr:VWA domain-containing protein [Treponema sp.]
MSFDYPLFLLGLAAFVPLVLADGVSPRRRRIVKSLPGRMKTRFLGSTALFRLSMAFLLVAMAGPRWGPGPVAGEYRRAVDVVLAFDVSRSMEVQDGYGTYGGPGGGPTRLDRGLDIVGEAVGSLPGTRFGVAISRGRGVLAVPLTWDTGTVASFLEALGGSAITGRGTNLESLLDAAVGAFQPSPPSRRVVVLVSDGEETSGSLRAAVDRGRGENVSVVALALGSFEGGTFPGGGQAISRRDSATMRMAASQSGGLYIDGSHQDAARLLAAHLGAGAPGVGAAGTGTGQRSRWFLFAALSLLAFGASKLCLLGSGRRRTEEAAQ